MKNIAVIGTGVIGTGWILRFLANDIRVKAFDKNSQQLHFLFTKFAFPERLFYIILLWSWRDCRSVSIWN